MGIPGNKKKRVVIFALTRFYLPNAGSDEEAVSEADWGRERGAPRGRPAVTGTFPHQFRRIRIPPSGVLRETILLRFVHAGFPQQADQLVFARAKELKTFPLGGRWHGEAVTDEGKRGGFLSRNGKRGKVRRCSSDSVRRKPSVRQPLIRPSVRTGAPSPQGEGLR